MPNNQTIIVTGGNRGIGFDLCRKLFGAGHNVILCSRSLRAGQEACEKVVMAKTSSSGSCKASELDVSSSSSVQDFISYIGRHHSHQIHALINNAGIYPDGWTQARFDTAMGTNFEGPVDLACGIAPHIHNGGKIVNVTSSLGQLQNLSRSYQEHVKGSTSLQQLRSVHFQPGNSPGSFKPTYCLTKAMINRASQLMSKLPLFQHISVNSVDPGWCQTDMGGAAASRSVSQGSDSILRVLQLPQDVTGGNWFDGRAASY